MKELTLSYNLFDLPTAQHKAGLAGLLVMIETMKRRNLEPLPEVVEVADFRATISFTKESLQCVFDDFFAANEINGKAIPTAKYLEVMGMPPLWLNLWRDVVTGVLRAGAPTQMESFRDRTGEYPKLDANCPTCNSGILKKKKGNLRKCICTSCGYTSRHKPEIWDWGKLWTDIEDNLYVKLSGTDIIGVESINAEKVPFSAGAKDTLLLFFWPVVTLPYVSQQLTRPKSGQKRDYLFSYYAYVLAIPEVSNLADFTEEIFSLYPQGLDDSSAGKSIRPLQSLISIDKEAALKFASRKNVGDLNMFPIPDFVSAIDIIHLKYGKGSAELIEEHLVIPQQTILEKYKRISSYKNIFFKSQMIENLFSDNDWYQGMVRILSMYPVEFFIYSLDDTPNKIPFFGRDTKRKFLNIMEELKQMEDEEMKTEEGRDNVLARRVYELVRHYVRIKAESKSGKKLEAFPKDEKGHITLYPQEYREEVEKVCMDAFLAIRGRREQDFVEYFTGAICSVPQFLPADDYLLVSQALLDDWEKMKSLSMLAISANSYLSQPKQTKGE